MISCLNLFSWNIDRASSRDTTTRWNFWSSAAAFVTRASIAARSWSESVCLRLAPRVVFFRVGFLLFV